MSWIATILPSVFGFFKSPINTLFCAIAFATFVLGLWVGAGMEKAKLTPQIESLKLQLITSQHEVVELKLTFEQIKSQNQAAMLEWQKQSTALENQLRIANQRLSSISTQTISEIENDTNPDLDQPIANYRTLRLCILSAEARGDTNSSASCDAATRLGG